MKRIILLIVFIFCKNISFSQTYSKMYDIFGGWESEFNIINSDSNGILILGDFTDRFNPKNADSPIINAVTLSQLNSSGILYKSKYFYTNDYIYFTGWKSYKFGQTTIVFLKDKQKEIRLKMNTFFQALILIIATLYFQKN